MAALTVDPERVAQLDTLTLLAGAHTPNTDFEMCVMEAVAWVAGEPWSDSPSCASPVIAAFLRRWNDALDDDGRQQLKPYIVRLVGTKGTKAQEDTRRWMAADWLVHTGLPLWLRAAGLDDQADAVEALPEVTNGTSWSQCEPALWTVRDLCWERSRAWREQLAEKIQAELAKRMPAVADAVADADADAAADAAAVADAVADAAAVAVADAVADAAGGDRWGAVYTAVYGAVRSKLRARWAEFPAIKAATTSAQQSAHQLLERMIEVTA